MMMPFSENWNNTFFHFLRLIIKKCFFSQLKRPPVVKERRIRLKAPKIARGSTGGSPRRRRSPLFEEIGRTPAPPRPPPVKIPYNIWVSWRQQDVDWPMCLARVEFLYINLPNNIVRFNKTFNPPFDKLMEFDLDDKLIPCSDDFDYVTKVDLEKVFVEKN